MRSTKSSRQKFVSRLFSALGSRSEFISFHQINSEDDLRLFESWATETYFRRCEEEPQSYNTQLENLKAWDQMIEDFTI